MYKKGNAAIVLVLSLLMALAVFDGCAKKKTETPPPKPKPVVKEKKPAPKPQPRKGLSEELEKFLKSLLSRPDKGLLRTTHGFTYLPDTSLSHSGTDSHGKNFRYKSKDDFFQDMKGTYKSKHNKDWRKQNRDLFKKIKEDYDKYLDKQD